MKARGHQEKKSIVLVNDAVTTLIGGKAACPDRQFDSYIGFIWGTGTNTCYMEQTRRITKLGSAADIDGTMLINVESGGYAKAPRGAFSNTASPIWTPALTLPPLTPAAICLKK